MPFPGCFHSKIRLLLMGFLTLRQLILFALPFVRQQIPIETVEDVNIIDLVDEPVKVFADLRNIH